MRKDPRRDDQSKGLLRSSREQTPQRTVTDQFRDTGEEEEPSPPQPNLPVVPPRTRDWSTLYSGPWPSRGRSDRDTEMWKRTASDDAFRMFDLEALTADAFTDHNKGLFATMATNDVGYKRVAFIHRVGSSTVGVALEALLTRFKDAKRDKSLLARPEITGGYNRFYIASDAQAAIPGAIWPFWKDFTQELRTAMPFGDVEVNFGNFQRAAHDLESLTRIGLRAPMPAAALEFRKATGEKKARRVAACAREAQLTMYMHAHDLTPKLVGQCMTETGLHMLMEAGWNDLTEVLKSAAEAPEGYMQQARVYARLVEDLLRKASFSPVNALLLDIKTRNVLLVLRDAAGDGSASLSPKLIDFDGAFTRIMKVQNAPEDICVYTINMTLLLLSFACEMASQYTSVREDNKLFRAYAMFAEELRESFKRRIGWYKGFTGREDIETGTICDQLQVLLMGDAAKGRNIDAATTSMGIAMMVLRQGIFYLTRSVLTMQLCTEIKRWEFSTQEALWPQLVKLAETPTEDLVGPPSPPASPAGGAGGGGAGPA